MASVKTAALRRGGQLYLQNGASRTCAAVESSWGPGGIQAHRFKIWALLSGPVSAVVRPEGPHRSPGHYS